jgi:hypothetical protein
VVLILTLISKKVLLPASVLVAKARPQERFCGMPHRVCFWVNNFQRTMIKSFGTRIIRMETDEEGLL